MQSMGDGHYAVVFSVIDQQSNLSNLHYRIFDSSTGSFDGGAKFLGQVEGSWLNFGLQLEEPGRLSMVITTTTNSLLKLHTADQQNFRYPSTPITVALGLTCHTTRDCRSMLTGFGSKQGTENNIHGFFR